MAIKFIERVNENVGVYFCPGSSEEMRHFGKTKLRREVYLWEHGIRGVVVIDTVQAVNIAIYIRGIVKKELTQTLLRKQKNFMPLLKKQKMELIK